MTDKIWCMFSQKNDYDQPDRELVGWWREKPNFETVLKAMNGRMDQEQSILAAANVVQGGVGEWWNVFYRLEEVSEGLSDD